MKSSSLRAPAILVALVLVANCSPDQTTGPSLVQMHTFGVANTIGTPLTYTQVSAGGSHTCALRSDAAVVCWGRNNFGQTTVPAGSYTQVSAGDAHTCAVKVGGNLACWGYDGAFEVSEMPLGNFTQVSASLLRQTCALRTDGSVVCWGRSGTGALLPPTPAGLYTQVSAGGFHTCAVKQDASLACWPANSQQPTGVFTQVSAGGSTFSCAIRQTTAALACWPSSFAAAVPPAGSFVQVSAGGNHTCAVTTLAAVACWGVNTAGQAPATMPGSFTQVSGGNAHTCAVKTDGTILCWGLNSFGQATPPAPAVTLAAGDASVNEGETITVSGAFSGTGLTLTADNVVGTFTPNNLLGTWTWTYATTDDVPATSIIVTATDVLARTVLDEFTYQAANVAPSAAFHSPAAVPEGAEFGIWFSDQADPSTVDAAGLTYAFDCGTGAYGAFSTVEAPTCTAGLAGVHTVRGTVKDKDGGTHEYTTLVTFGGVAPPSVLIAAADAVITEGMAFSLSGKFVGGTGLTLTANNSAGMFTPNNSLGTWTWTRPTNDNEAGTITVVATDVLGRTAVDVFTYEATNVAPSATFNVQPSVHMGAQFGVYFSSPTDPSSVDASFPFEYALDCGNGVYGPFSDVPLTTCTAGLTSLQVRGKIKDKDGGERVYAATVTIANQLPVANAGLDRTVEATSAAGAQVTLTGLGSDADGDALTYKWTGPFADLIGPSQQVQLPFGTSTLTLAVSDALATQIDLVKITVQDNTPPTTTITSSLVNVYNTSFSFASSDAVGVAGHFCKLDAAPFVACTSPMNYRGLTAGNHLFQVKAADTHANTGIPATSAWWISNDLALSNLLTSMQTMGLPGSVYQSLKGILDPLSILFNDNISSNDKAGCATLNSFLKSVARASLTQAQAESLKKAADALKTELGC